MRLGASPADGMEVLIGPVQVPVGQKQFGIRRQAVQDLGAEDAVLTVLGLQIAVSTEGMSDDVDGQGTAQVDLVAPPAGVENCDLDALAAIPGGMPAIHTQPCQMLGSELRSGRQEGR